MLCGTCVYAKVLGVDILVLAVIHFGLQLWTYKIILYYISTCMYVCLFIGEQDAELHRCQQFLSFVTTPNKDFKGKFLFDCGAMYYCSESRNR